ncbi:MAG: hypothetical protein QF673_01005 [Candidatus Hydrothermarchaeota archaeon]|jgi:hypothetical protein|nr:hypothetical protein [Candidatus Hydrothermarchaeota archaeon]
MTGKRLTIRAKDLVDMLLLKNHLAFMRKYNLSRDELIKIKIGLKKGHWAVAENNELRNQRSSLFAAPTPRSKKTA